MAFASGRLGKVRVGATVVAVTKWSVDYVVNDKLEVTNTEGNGFGEYLGTNSAGASSGVRDLNFNLTLNYDIGTNPVALLTPGKTVAATVTLYLNDTTGPSWSIPTAIIQSNGNAIEVRGLVTLDVKGYSTGTFTAPTS